MKKILLMLTSFILVLLISCKQQENQIVSKKYDHISTNHMAIKKMDVYKDINAIGWFNDQQIFEKKQRGLYLHDLNTQKRKLLYEDPTISLPVDPDIIPLIMLSPDKKHLFFQSMDGRSDYYILNLETNKTIQIQHDHLLSVAPNWVDNKSLIFANPTGEIFIIHLDGKVTKINHFLPKLTDKESRYQLTKVGTQLFYIENETLWVWDQRTKQTKQLMKYVNNFVLSPDKKQLAVVQRNESLESLLLLDLTGHVQSTIATGSEIRNIVWSENANKLAYYILKITQPPKLYVLDRTESRATLFAINLRGEPIAWNPVGTKLLINEVTNPIQPDLATTLYIITSK